MSIEQSPRLISPYGFLNDNFYDQAYPAKFPKLILRYRNHNFDEFNNLNDEEWNNIFGSFESKFLPSKKNLSLEERFDWLLRIIQFEFFIRKSI